jgi:SAM-dependent methyltransferase
MSDRRYSFDAELRIWRTPSHDSIAYTDGDDVEHHLLSALQQCSDLSSTSDELRRHIVDWPSEYHFSPARHNLLSAFRIGPRDRILEFGCGCGAITRYLGETGATVVAVEGSRGRATIAAERCRDLPNVSVICDNLAAFESPDHFDLVTLIGVLEYSPQFIAGGDPVRTCLSKARSYLSDGGGLILAIENRLGLKYLSGCNEDHVGRPFFGIEDLYDTSTAVTLGRRELLGALESAGFSAAKCLFPFPDYKLPSLIVSEAGVAEPLLRVGDLLLCSHSPDRVAAGLRSFSEPLAWGCICRNGLLPDLSNSFLYIAGGSTVSLEARLRDFLALSFSGNRLIEYATETAFQRDGSEIIVTKRKLSPSLPAARALPARPHLKCDKTPYLPGSMYLGKLMRQWRKDPGIEPLTQWVRPWMAMLVGAALPDGEYSSKVLPGEYFDCIPFNLLEGDDGRLHFIDREWQIDGMIPLSWVFIRGLAYALANCVSPPGFDATIRSIIAETGARVGIPLTDQCFCDASAREQAIQVDISGPAVVPFSLDSILDSVPRAVSQVFDAHRYSESLNAQLRAALAAMAASRSWKITAPLRAADNFIKKLLRGIS